MMMAGALFLMTGCSADDVVKETTSEEPIAISFSCNYDGEPEQPTRAGHEGVMNTEDLYATGFGVMASTTAGTVEPYDNKPNLMYNQEVEFTFVGDREELIDPEHTELGVKKGYWSYSPLKYWPTDLEHCYISAYAPYVDPTSLVGLPADATGIIGISPNSEAPYITYRRCKKPNEVVDLLWYYKNFAPSDKIPEATATKPAGTLNMKMHHALARLEIKVALASAPASGTKVLIEKITLKGNMTKTAKLILNKDDGTGDDHYPHWEALETPDVEDRTIQITNIDNDTKSYGIIDAQVRYIPGMPYAWQPQGLKVYDAEKEDKNFLNALSTGDRVGYIYLIPLGSLSLTVKVKYHKMTAGGDDTGIRTTHVSETPITISPFYGNIPYSLNLTLSNI